VNEIEKRWAWSQVEEMADGGLSADDARRMRVAMAQDTELQNAVRRALRLRRELSRLRAGPVPRSFSLRLMRIPQPARGKRPNRWPLAGALAATLAIAALALGISALRDRAPKTSAATEERRAEAVADFAIAMTYLQRSAALARTEVGAAVRDGVRDAIDVSRAAVRDKPHASDNGD
jgi:anti-sigma factor RsiW